jgi:hypothetical protein
VQARAAVDDGIDRPADRRGHDRHAAGHRLERHDPERLVPGHARHRVGGAQERGQAVTRDPAAEVHAVCDALRASQAQQPRTLGVLGQHLRRWASGDDELRARNVRERRDRRADALALDHPAHHRDPGPS